MSHDLTTAERETLLALRDGPQIEDRLSQANYEALARLYALDLAQPSFKDDGIDIFPTATITDAGRAALASQPEPNTLGSVLGQIGQLLDESGIVGLSWSVDHFPARPGGGESRDRVVLRISLPTQAEGREADT